MREFAQVELEARFFLPRFEGRESLARVGGGGGRDGPLAQALCVVGVERYAAAGLVENGDRGRGGALAVARAQRDLQAFLHEGERVSHADRG